MSNKKERVEVYDSMGGQVVEIVERALSPASGWPGYTAKYKGGTYPAYRHPTLTFSYEIYLDDPDAEHVPWTKQKENLVKAIAKLDQEIKCLKDTRARRVRKLDEVERKLEISWAVHKQKTYKTLAAVAKAYVKKHNCPKNRGGRSWENYGRDLYFSRCIGGKALTEGWVFWLLEDEKE